MNGPANQWYLKRGHKKNLRDRCRRKNLGKFFQRHMSPWWHHTRSQQALKIAPQVFELAPANMRWISFPLLCSLICKQDCFWNKIGKQKATCTWLPLTICILKNAEDVEDKDTTERKCQKNTNVRTKREIELRTSSTSGEIQSSFSDPSYVIGFLFLE